MDPRRFNPQPARSTVPAETTTPVEPVKVTPMPPIPAVVNTSGDVVRDHMAAVQRNATGERVKQLCRENPWLVPLLKDPPKL